MCRSAQKNHVLTPTPMRAGTVPKIGVGKGEDFSLLISTVHAIPSKIYLEHDPTPLGGRYKT